MRIILKFKIKQKKILDNIFVELTGDNLKSAQV